MNKTEIHKISEFKSLDPEFPYMPKAEWESRINKARTMMDQKGIDALLILNMEDRLYFFGSQRTYKFVYPSVGIIPRNGPTTLITISDDRDVLHKQGYAERSIGYRGDIMAPTATSPDPIKLIAEVIDDLGLANKTIGMEFGPFMIWDAFTQNSWEQLKRELPKVKFVDATDQILEMRMIKSPWEIDVERYLYKATVAGYNEIIKNAKPGVNERKLFYDAVKVWMDMGIVESSFYYFQCINAVQPYRDRILKEGDWILLDGGPSYKGYCSDIQRMIYIGNLDQKSRKMGDVASTALREVEKILKPGITVGELWMKAYSTIAETDPDVWRKARSRRFPSWIGHGEGLGCHEFPYLVEGSKAILKEGMVIAIEIPSFNEKIMVNMPEDAYLITQKGYEKLTENFGNAAGGISVCP